MPTPLLPSNLHIVTDSAVLLTDLSMARQNNLTIVPFSIELKGRRYYEGVDIDSDAYWHYVRDTWPPPPIHPPSVQDYQHAFERIRNQADAVFVLPSSHELSASHDNARAAVQQHMGRLAIRLFPTQNIAVGLGLMVEAVMRAGAKKQAPEDVQRLLHSMLNRTYTMFYLTNMRPLQSMGQITQSQAILGKMLEIQPLLTLEDGRILPIEKVYNRAAAYEKLAEFTAEFTNLESLMIMYGNPEQGDDLRALRDRLTLDFPGRYLPTITYGPSLAGLLGTGAIGVTVLENEEDDDEIDRDDD